MDNQKLILFNDLKKYFKIKDPFFTNYDSTFGEAFSSSGLNLTINHQHHHYGYDWGWRPGWWWYPSQNTTIVNHNYGSDQTINQEKKEKKKGITGSQIMAGILMVGAVSGVSYLFLKDFFNYREEKDLLNRLKTMGIKTTHNQLFVNAKPLLKQNQAYSRDFLIAKTIGLTSSLVLLADIFYWDDENIMNTCFAVIAGSMVFGIGRYFYYSRTNQSSQSEASYKQVHSILYGEQSGSNINQGFQETGPRPPPYNPDTKKDQ